MIHFLNFRRLTACLLLCSTLLGCSERLVPEVSKDTKASASAIAPEPIKRTIMVYMIGSDLESDGSEGSADLKEIVSAPQNPHTKIVIQTGGADRVGWDSVRRLSVDEGILKEHENLGEVNLGKSTSLSDFLRWSATTFPADEYMLILWSHGSGSVNLHGTDYGLVGPDEIFEDSLTALEIKQALERVKSEQSLQFSIIGFDACLMGTVEVANLLQPYANYLLASQELEPGNGWNYKSWLTALASQPGMSSQDLGKKIIDTYFDFYSAKAANSQLTLSFTDLSKLPQLIEATDAWAKAASLALQASEQAAWAFARARSQSENYGREGRFDSGMVDLKDFITGVSQQFSKTDFKPTPTNDARLLDTAILELPKLGNEVTAGLKQSVVYTRSSSDRAWASGLSTFIPSSFQLFSNESRRAVKSQIKPLPMSVTWKSMLDAYRTTLENAGIDLEINSVAIDPKSSKLSAKIEGNPDLVEDIFLAVFEEKNGEVTVLGNALVDEDTSLNGSTIQVSINEPLVLSIDGQTAHYFIIDVTDEYWMLTVPTVINGEDSDLLIKRSTLGDVATFKILGYKAASQVASSKLKAFKAGDSVQLMYPQFSRSAPDEVNYVAKHAARKLTRKEPTLALIPIPRKSSSRLGFYYFDQFDNFSISINTQSY
jgi:Clostripain family